MKPTCAVRRRLRRIQPVDEAARLTASNGSGGSGLLSASDAIRALPIQPPDAGTQRQAGAAVLHPYDSRPSVSKPASTSAAAYSPQIRAQRWTLAQQDSRTFALVSAQQPWLPDVEPAEMEKAQRRAINQVAFAVPRRRLVACRFQ